MVTNELIFLSPDFLLERDPNELLVLGVELEPGAWGQFATVDRQQVQVQLRSAAVLLVPAGVL